MYPPVLRTPRPPSVSSAASTSNGVPAPSTPPQPAETLRRHISSPAPARKPPQPRPLLRRRTAQYVIEATPGSSSSSSGSHSRVTIPIPASTALLRSACHRDMHCSSHLPSSPPPPLLPTSFLTCHAIASSSDSTERTECVDEAAPHAYGVRADAYAPTHPHARTQPPQGPIRRVSAEQYTPTSVPAVRAAWAGRGARLGQGGRGWAGRR